MKEKRIVLLTLISFILLLFLLVPGISFGKELTGKIIEAKRECFITQEGTGDWIKALKGMPVSGGSRLKTGEKSSMIVELNNDVIKLGPMTEIELSDFQSEIEIVSGDSGKGSCRSSTVIGLIAGKIYGKVKKLTNNSVFEIRSDISIAGVRGTAFSVDRVGENSFSTVVVLWGVVSFMSVDPKTGDSIGDPVSVGRKESSTVTSGTPASTPIKAPKGLIKALSTAYNNMTDAIESLTGGGDGSGGCS